MTIQITIRNVPESVRSVLAARAGARGQSMQEFLHQELVRLASLPAIEETLVRIRTRKDRTGRDISPEDIIELRDQDRR